MQYAILGKTGLRVSRLGFGCMRLPMRAGEVNEPETARLLHHAVEHGVNYVDTAYSYHDGESEPVLGRALAGGWRDRVLLATKLPSWRASSLDECDRILTDQLERLQTDHLDFYLVHNLIRPRWEQVRDIGVLDWLRDVRSEGRIRHVGFSFHDEIDCFRSIIDAWDWDFCQIQYNYMDEHVQAGTEGLLYAADRDIDVVVMEPLRGGALGRKLPKDLETRRRRLGIEWSPGQLALRWVLDHPEVRVALSGMNRMDHLEENLAVADATPPGGMTGVEREFKVRISTWTHAVGLFVVVVAGARDLRVVSTRIPGPAGKHGVGFRTTGRDRVDAGLYRCELEPDGALFAGVGTGCVEVDAGKLRIAVLGAGKLV